VGDFRDVLRHGGRIAVGSRSAAAELRLFGPALHVMQCPEAVCLGGAILAGVHRGSVRELAGGDRNSWSARFATISPDPALAQSLRRSKSNNTAIWVGAHGE